MKMGSLGDIKAQRGYNNLRSRDVHVAKIRKAGKGLQRMAKRG